MTVVRGDEEGLRRLGGALDANVPVVLPLPTPLPYVVAGTGAGTVNVVKGRPAGQAVGVVVADFAMVTRLSTSTGRPSRSRGGCRRTSW